jgi:AcrR family transcriptional regulator
MGVTERKARQKESLRQEILDAAGQILLNEGFKQFSMRHIAERIEYTPTTIYLHFKDKKDLLFHLCDEVYGKVVEILQSAGTEEKDPFERLRAAMRAYIEFGLSDPDRYRIAFMTGVASDIDPASFLKPGSMAMTAYEILKQRVSDALQKTRNCDDDVEAVAQTLWASAHGLISLVVNHPDFPWVERSKLIGTTIDLLMGGLAGQSAKKWSHRS